MKYILIIFLLFNQITFCAQGNDQKKNKTNTLNNISGTYSEKLEIVKGSHPRKSFLNLLGLDNSVADSVKLSIIDNRLLKVEFKDKYGPCYELFEGKQKKEYFQFYTVKERFTVPIFYGKVNIHRLRIQYLHNGNIELKEYSNNSSNLFFMAAGGSSHKTYILKK